MYNTYIAVTQIDEYYFIDCINQSAIVPSNHDKKINYVIEKLNKSLWSITYVFRFRNFMILHASVVINEW